MYLKSSWQTRKLGEVAKFLRGPFGSSIKRSVCIPKGGNTYKVYEQGNIIGDNFSAGEYYVSEEKFKQLEKFELKSRDIVITCAGTIGKIALAPEGLEKGIINSVLMRVRPDTSKVATKYLFYFFQNPDFQNRISNKVNGVAIKNMFATSELRDFNIFLPPIGKQMKIIERLDAIRKAQELCDTQFFKTEELFGSLLKQEFTRIKNFQKMSEVAEILMGQSPPSSTYNYNGDGLPFFQGKAEFGDIYPKISKYCSLPIRVAELEDILLSVRAPVGPINIAPFKCCIGRGLSSIRAKREFFQKYLFYFMKFNEENLSKQGTGSTFSAINKTNIENISVPIVTFSEQKNIAKKLDSIQKYKKILLKQKSLLKELFDSVLCKSMKGEMDN